MTTIWMILATTVLWNIDHTLAAWGVVLTVARVIDEFLECYKKWLEKRNDKKI